MTEVMTDLSAYEAEKLPRFADPAALLGSAVDLLRPPRRLTIPQAAERYRVLRNPGGGYSGPWRNAQVPYMVEPAEMLTSRRHEAVVFAGPAQSAKTAMLVENTILYSAACDPADVLVVQMSADQARDYSRRRLDSMIRESDILQQRLLPERDNVFDKAFQGMLLSIGYPAVSQLSGRSIPRVLLTDYDRMPQDVDTEGSPFDLSMGRAKTFGSRKMILAESSPGFPIQQAKWKPDTPHQAPPTLGILALYNRGDRRRWYWPCRHCGEYFEGRFRDLRYPVDATPEEAGLAAVMICPSCGSVIEPKERSEMNARGKWVPDGMTITPAGQLHGPAPSADIASYWLFGTAAAFMSWGKLVTAYCRALETYERSGDEQPLKTTVNIDQGDAYLEKASEVEASLEAQDLIDRAVDYPLRRVPPWVRFLTAFVDVQNNRFDVLVRGWGVAMESIVLNRFVLFKTRDRNGIERQMDPPHRAEDWDVLFEELFHSRMKLLEDETRGMKISVIGIDSGGAPGVTPNAYGFYRKAFAAGLHRRLVLTKGEGGNKPRMRKTMPDSERKDRHAQGRGEIPVWLFNSNTLKDELAVQLELTEPGAFHVHLSQRLKNRKPPHTFFEELTAEQRQRDGTWQKIRTRNEALDCMVGCHVAALALKADKIRWDAPPAWALPHADNPMIGRMDETTPAPMLGRKRRRVRSKGIH